MDTEDIEVTQTLNLREQLMGRAMLYSRSPWSFYDQVNRQLAFLLDTRKASSERRLDALSQANHDWVLRLLTTAQRPLSPSASSRVLGAGAMFPELVSPAFLFWLWRSVS